MKAIFSNFFIYVDYVNVGTYKNLFVLNNAYNVNRNM